MKRSTRALILAGSMVITALAAANPAMGKQVADYHFDGTRLSGGGAAPATLTAGTPSYARETNQKCGALKYDKGAGVTIPVQGLSQFTIVVRFEHDEVDPMTNFYKRIINFDGNTLDQENGLYSRIGRVSFYKTGANPSPPSLTPPSATPGQFLTAAITRDGAGTVKTYFNGVPQATVNDAATPVATLDNGLVFFKDNTSGGTSGEESAGAVDRIQVFDTALADADLTTDNACVPPPKCNGKFATIAGTNGKDTLRGTAKADVIVGQNGNDKILGLAGNDTICGGGGKDKINGGKGSDKLSGGGGKDTLAGGKGNDKCVGGASKDHGSGCEKGRL